MRFVTDGMLGKLTRWLRMMGHDVEYPAGLDDKKLLLIAKKEQRILLTRDLELYRHAIGTGINAFYLRAEREHERIAQVSRRYHIPLRIDMKHSRCPKCNTPVFPAPKEKIKDKVETDTYRLHDKFWICLGCNQVYWQGAHWTKIREKLDSAEKTLSEIEIKRKG